MPEKEPRLEPGAQIVENERTENGQVVRDATVTAGPLRVTRKAA